MIARANWINVYRETAHIYDRDNEMVYITRETARLAKSALDRQNESDYFHNYGAAARELSEVLKAPLDALGNEL
jgi:hypothetical protein